MQKIRVCFEEDPAADGIEVRVRAPEKNAEVEALIERISDPQAEALIATGSDGSRIRLLPDEIVSVSVNGKTVQIVLITAFGVRKNRYSGIVSNQVLLDDLFEET